MREKIDLGIEDKQFQSTLQLAAGGVKPFQDQMLASVSYPDGNASGGRRRPKHAENEML
jgi:hypothetical protein